MTTSLYCLPKSFFLVYIFCMGLWCLFGPAVLYAEDSPVQVELGPYKTIVAKDPFDPKRGKEQGLTGDSSSVAEKDLKSRYQVYGTIIVGEMRMAYLKVAKPRPGSFIRSARGKGKNIRTVRPGDLVDGWSVKDITPRGVVFRSSRGESVQIGIFDTAKKGEKTGTPVAFQAPQPRPYTRPTPRPGPTKRISRTGPSHRPGNKKALQLQKIFAHHRVLTGPGIHTEKKAGTRPNFFVSPASPGYHGRTNPFLELLKRARERRERRQ